jgi:hypothetical protein
MPLMSLVSIIARTDLYPGLMRSPIMLSFALPNWITGCPLARLKLYTRTIRDGTL